MTTATPTVGADLVAKIVAMATAGGFGADFPVAKVLLEAEGPTGGAVTEGGMTWAKFVAEEREDYDKDGALRFHTFQLKRRTDRVTDPKATLGFASMVKLYDALQKLHAWTGASGAVYTDLICRTFPRILEENYIVMDVVVEFDSVST